MSEYKNEALAILDNLTDSPYKANLKQLVEFVIERSK